MNVLFINGPNLNMLGTREKDVYGDLTLDKINELIKNKGLEVNIKTDFFQSNIEGNIVSKIQESSNYDYIVIETSGVTDPKNIIASLDASFGKMYRARLDNVICMIDCDSWDDSTVASQNQIKYADTIILNKIDLLVNNKKEAVLDDDFSSNY